jgi:predicted amidophosphoribosyltransferase
MSDKDYRFCEVCHTRATQFICDGVTGVTKAFCATCYEQSVSPVMWSLVKQFRDTIQSGRCKYCDEPAVRSSGFGGHIELWCEQCGQDLAEFAHRPENALPTDLPFDDVAAQERLLQQLTARDRRQEEFMKQKILERGER